MTTLATRVGFSKDIQFQDLAGETVLLNLQTGQYYGLNEVGSRMWALLSEHGSVMRAYEALVAEYDVTEEQLREDLLSLVDDLISHGLLETDES